MVCGFSTSAFRPYQFLNTKEIIAWRHIITQESFLTIVLGGEESITFISYYSNQIPPSTKRVCENCAFTSTVIYRTSGLSGGGYPFYLQTRVRTSIASPCHEEITAAKSVVFSFHVRTNLSSLIPSKLKMNDSNR